MVKGKRGKAQTAVMLACSCFIISKKAYTTVESARVEERNGAKPCTEAAAATLALLQGSVVSFREGGRGLLEVSEVRMLT